jgi:hypothetical protein
MAFENITLMISGSECSFKNAIRHQKEISSFSLAFSVIIREEDNIKVYAEFAQSSLFIFRVLS